MRRISVYWRAIRPGIPWLAALILVLGAVVLWAAGLEAQASFFLIVLAAATSLVQLFRQFADASQQRRRDEAQNAQLEAQARDLKRLADIAERSQEAQQQHRPAPLLEAVDRRTGATGDHLTLVRPPTPVVDRDAIIRSRLGRLREGMAPASGALDYADALMATIAKMSTVDEGAYRRDLDRYEANLGAWLDEVGAALARQHEVVQVPLEIRNVGGAPLQKAEVIVRLPAGVTAAEAPSLPDGPPSAPKRRSVLDGLSTRIPDVYSPIADFTASSIGGRLIEGPILSDDGSEAVWELSELLHQRAMDIDGDDVLWIAAEDGDYELEWEIHATNLESPVPGVVRLTITTLDTEPVRFWELEPLESAFWPVDDAS